MATDLANAELEMPVAQQLGLQNSKKEKKNTHTTKKNQSFNLLICMSTVRLTRPQATSQPPRRVTESLVFEFFACKQKR